MSHRKGFIFFLLFFLSSGLLLANTAEQVELHLAHLIFQVILILIAGKIGGDLASFASLPRPLGQLLMGILISPHFLGGSFIEFFNAPLFPLNELSSDIPVSNEIYLLSSLAFIILLFMAGLETNINLFLKYFLKGSFVGFAEMAVAFFGTLFFTSYYFSLPLMDPTVLFVSAFIAPTSVAIMAEVLSRTKKMGSPEGVIIITSAVIDDILTIILLSIVMGLVSISGEGGSLTFWDISWVTIKSLLILVIFGFLSLIASKKLVKGLKKISFNDNAYIAVLALIIALVASVFMQVAGLSLVVGAYIMGLAFSNTEIKFMLRDKLTTVENLFVPLFFVVMGMYVDIHVLLQPSTLMAGLLFSILAIVLKVIGNGIPAKLIGFNWFGTARIGFGMVSRGELTLIIASTALGLNFISSEVFAIAVAVTFIPSLVTSPLITYLFKSNRKGVDSSEDTSDKEFSYELPSYELTKVVSWELETEFEAEGYYVYPSKMKGKTIYQVRKERTFFTFVREENRLIFSAKEEDVFLIKTFLYEILLKLTDDLGKIKGLFDHQEMAKAIESRGSLASRDIKETLKFFNKDNIIFLDETSSKDSVIRELVNKLPLEEIERESIYQAVLERESQYTTGLPGGLAIPHARVEQVERTEVVIGFMPQGMDFKAMDNKLSYIFVLIVSPIEGASLHLEIMAKLSNLLNPNKIVFKELLKAKNINEILAYLKDVKPSDLEDKN